MSFTLLDAGLILGVVAGLLIMMGLVRLAGRRFSLEPEVQRKLVHVATGCTALTFPLLFSNPLPVLVMMGAAIVLMLALRSGALGGLGSVLHGVERQSYGEVYLALAIAIIFLRAEEQPVLYVLPILVITLSDTASALVGTAYGRRRFTVEGGFKSIEGVVAFFVVTWLSALIVLLLMTDAARINIVLLSLLIAGFCALVEADSWRGLDNLFVPIGAYLLLASNLQSGPAELALTAAILIVLLSALVGFAPALRLTHQAARAYAVLLFLIISIVSLHNAVLPAFVIVMQLLARGLRPCRSPRPDLDLLFVAAAVSLFWMFVGDALYRSVISLFNLTFAGAALGFATITLRGYWRLLLLPLAGATTAVVLWVVEANMPYSGYFVLTWWEVAIALAVSCAVPLLRHDWFADRRSLKVFGLAMIVPLALCLRGVAIP